MSRWSDILRGMSIFFGLKLQISNSGANLVNLTTGLTRVKPEE